MLKGLVKVSSLVDFPSPVETARITVPVVVTTTGSVYSVAEGVGTDPSVV